MELNYGLIPFKTPHQEMEQAYRELIKVVSPESH
jgi:hypothetical protein